MTHHYNQIRFVKKRIGRNLREPNQSDLFQQALSFNKNQLFQSVRLNNTDTTQPGLKSNAIISGRNQTNILTEAASQEHKEQDFFKRKNLLNREKLKQMYDEPTHVSDNDVFKAKSRIRSNELKYQVGKSLINHRDQMRRLQSKQISRIGQQLQNQSNLKVKQKQQEQVNGLTFQNQTTRNFAILGSKAQFPNYLSESQEFNSFGIQSQMKISGDLLSTQSLRANNLKHQNLKEIDETYLVSNEGHSLNHNLGKFYCTYSSRLQQEERRKTLMEMEKEAVSQRYSNRKQDLKRETQSRDAYSSYSKVNRTYDLKGRSSKVALSQMIKDEFWPSLKAQNIKSEDGVESKEIQTKLKDTVSRSLPRTQNAKFRMALSKNGGFLDKSEILQPIDMYGDGAVSANLKSSTGHQQVSISQRSKLFESKKVSTCVLDSQISQESNLIHQLVSSDRAISDVNIRVYQDANQTKEESLEYDQPSHLKPNPLFSNQCYESTVSNKNNLASSFNQDQKSSGLLRSPNGWYQNMENAENKSKVHKFLNLEQSNNMEEKRRVVQIKSNNHINQLRQSNNAYQQTDQDYARVYSMSSERCIQDDVLQIEANCKSQGLETSQVIHKLNNTHQVQAFTQEEKQLQLLKSNPLLETIKNKQNTDEIFDLVMIKNQAFQTFSQAFGSKNQTLTFSQLDSRNKDRLTSYVKALKSKSIKPKNEYEQVSPQKTNYQTENEDLKMSSQTAILNGVKRRTIVTSDKRGYQGINQHKPESGLQTYDASNIYHPQGKNYDLCGQGKMKKRIQMRTSRTSRIEQQLRQWLYGNYHIKLQNQIKAQRDIPTDNFMSDLFQEDTTEENKMQENKDGQHQMLTTNPYFSTGKLISDEERHFLDESRRKSTANDSLSHPYYFPSLIDEDASHKQYQRYQQMNEYGGRLVLNQEEKKHIVSSISTDNIRKLNVELQRENGTLVNFDGQLYLSNGFQIFDQNPLYPEHQRYTSSEDKRQENITAQEQSLEVNEQAGNDYNFLSQIVPTIQLKHIKKTWKSPYQQHRLVSDRIRLQVESNKDKSMITSGRGKSTAHSNQQTLETTYQSQHHRNLLSFMQSQQVQQDPQNSSMPSRTNVDTNSSKSRVSHQIKLPTMDVEIKHPQTANSNILRAERVRLANHNQKHQKFNLKLFGNKTNATATNSITTTVVAPAGNQDGNTQLMKYLKYQIGPAIPIEQEDKSLQMTHSALKNEITGVAASLDTERQQEGYLKGLMVQSVAGFSKQLTNEENRIIQDLSPREVDDSIEEGRKIIYHQIRINKDINQPDNNNAMASQDSNQFLVNY